MACSLLNPTAQATIDTLSSAFGTFIQPGKALLKKSQAPLGDVTTMIEVTSEHFHGSLAIAFNEQSILSFTQLLINETHMEIDEVVEHIASDVGVMIGGGIKRRFASLGVTVSLKHPTVLVGYHHNISHPLPGLRVVFPLHTEDGMLFLETCFHTFKANPIAQQLSTIAA